MGTVLWLSVYNHYVFVHSCTFTAQIKPNINPVHTVWRSGLLWEMCPQWCSAVRPRRKLILLNIQNWMWIHKILHLVWLYVNCSSKHISWGSDAEGFGPSWRSCRQLLQMFWVSPCISLVLRTGILIELKKRRECSAAHNKTLRTGLGLLL